MRKTTSCLNYITNYIVLSKRHRKKTQPEGKLNYLFIGISFSFTYFRICLTKFVFSLAHVFLFFLVYSLEKYYRVVTKYIIISKQVILLNFFFKTKQELVWEQ